MGNPATYDAGYGGCSTYAVGLSTGCTDNNGYCAKDIAEGFVAKDVCSECGVCIRKINLPLSISLPFNDIFMHLSL